MIRDELLKNKPLIIGGPCSVSDKNQILRIAREVKEAGSGIKIVFGIQGGKGSFNEEALESYISKKAIKDYKIKYLYTSVGVLNALGKGEIDRGQFAIENSVGGLVQESIEAMANYKFRIVDQFKIIISHALMIRKDAKLAEIDTIMTHPQVLAQCKSTLAKKYPNLKKTSGKGEMIDHSVVAEKLAKKELPKNIATMGSKILSDIYDLRIVEENLQDAKKNYTTFLQVEKI